MDWLYKLFGLCCHEWSKWELVPGTFAMDKYQRKVCYKCGKIKQKCIGFEPTVKD